MPSGRVEYPRMTTSKHYYVSASALLAAAIAIAAFAMSASAASTLKITNCNKTASAPKLLTLTCGDGNTVLKGLSLDELRQASATAKGTFVIDLCEPNCAEGKNVSYPVNVKTTGAKKCKGTSVYSKLTLTFTGRKPKSANDSQDFGRLAARRSACRWRAWLRWLTRVLEQSAHRLVDPHRPMRLRRRRDGSG